MSNNEHSDDESATGAPVGQDGVSADSGRLWDAAFDAARDFIRRRYDSDGCVVGIGEVLDHLDDRFGKEAGLSSDVCTDLWDDPHIDQVAEGYIEFCWNEAGHRPSGVVHGSLRELLTARFERGGLS